MTGAVFLRDGLVEVRIEVLADRLDRLHALTAEDVVQLGIDELDALFVRRVRRFDTAREIEVIDDGEQVEQQIDDGLVGLLAALLLDAPAVVVELRGQPEQAVVEVVTLLLYGVSRPASVQSAG